MPKRRKPRSVLPKALVVYKDQVVPITPEQFCINVRKGVLSKGHFINYDAPMAEQMFERVLRQTKDHRKHSLFIIEEVHNFIRNVYSNITKSKSGIL